MRIEFDRVLQHIYFYFRVTVYEPHDFQTNKFVKATNAHDFILIQNNVAKPTSHAVTWKRFINRAKCNLSSLKIPYRS